MPHGLQPNKGPKEFQIASRSYGITAAEAADILIARNEILANKELNKAAMKILKEKKKAIDKTIL